VSESNLVTLNDGSVNVSMTLHLSVVWSLLLSGQKGNKLCPSFKLVRYILFIFVSVCVLAIWHLGITLARKELHLGCSSGMQDSRHSNQPSMAFGGALI